MAVLSVSAGLLFIFIFHIGFPADRFTESNLRLRHLDLHFIFIFQTACHHIKMQIAHTVEQCLPVLGIVHHLQGQVFVHKLL